MFFSAISNFYFFYMLTIMTLLYILLKLFFCVKDKKKSIVYLLKFSMYSVIGTLVGAFVLCPVIFHVLSEARLSNGYDYSSLLYPLRYYRFFLNFFSGYGSSGYWNYMGYGGFALLSVFVFLINWKKQDCVLKVLFLLLTAFLLLPKAGLLLNGLSYVSNRWIWAYSFVVALVVVTTWEQLCTIKLLEIKKIIICFLVYAVVNVIFDSAFTLSGIFQLILAAVVFLCIVFREKTDFLHKTANFTKLLSGFVMISVIGNAFFLYASFGVGYIKQFPYSFTDAYSRLRDNEVESITATAGEKDFVRFTASNPILTENANLLYGISSTQYYWSLTNNNRVKYYKDMSVLDNRIHEVSTLDGRTLLNEAASVKYYLSNNTHFLPFGYKLLKRNVYKDISFYENLYALPLGYTYSHYITPQEYSRMDSVQKQQALLQGVVLEGDTDKRKFKKAKTKFEDSDIPYKLTYNKKAVIRVENAFIVTKKNAVVNIEFEGKRDCETYLYIRGLQFKGVNILDLYEKQGKDSEFDPLDVYRPKDFDKLKESEKKKLKLNAKYWTEPTLINISATAFSGNMKTGSKRLSYTTPAYSWTSGRKDFIINTGYFRKPKNRIQIKFPHLGKYSFDQIKVVCQAFTNYPGYVKKLKENTLTHVDLHNHNRAFATNLVTGDINLKTDKILLLTIPYSKGWSAFVDNKPAKLYQANTMFMALKLNPGQHKIKLEYRTPGLKEGIMLSGLGLISLMGLMYWRRTRQPFGL
ncbi:MAG: YfhO family protein [Acidaminococcaceae bacterium]|nr:YfhO family protein [Acidaminococcaceae bacterium]